MMPITFTTTISPPDNEAPTFVQNASIPFQPIVGESLIADDPEADGSPDPTLSHQWYRGDPDDGGTLLSGETSLEYDAPTSDDYGENLFLRSTASNGVSPDAVSTVQTEITGYDRVELWDSGLDDYFITDDTSSTTNYSIVSDAEAPDGNAMQYWSSSVRAEVAPTTERNLALNNLDGTQETEVYAVIRTPPTDQGIFYIRIMEGLDDGESGGSAGVKFRYGTVMHVHPGEDNASAEAGGGGTDFTSVSLDTEYVVKIFVDNVKSIVKVWPLGDPEPDDSSASDVSTRFAADMPQGGVKFGTRLDISTSNRVTVLSWSIGMNTEAPDPGIEIIQAPSSDPFEDESPTEQTTISQMDGLITYTVEEDV